MRRGFTIIELLVASMLLGMLVTILTMIFNQSSIAWRTGMAGVSHLAQTRKDIAVIAEQADNIFVWDNKTYRITSLWDDIDGNGELRMRACDADQSKVVSQLNIFNDNTKPSSFGTIAVSGDAGEEGQGKTFIVNVMSAGPDRQWATYDDIWSFPEWQ